VVIFVYFVSLKIGGYVHCDAIDVNLYDDGSVMVVPLHGHWRMGEIDTREIRSVEKY